MNIGMDRYRIWKVIVRKGFTRVAGHTCLTPQTRDEFIDLYYKEFLQDQDPKTHFLDKFDILVTPYLVENPTQ